MNDEIEEYLLVQKLKVGHLQNRFDEINELIKQDLPPSEAIELIKESMTIIEEISKFQKEYACQIGITK